MNRKDQAPFCACFRYPLQLRLVTPSRRIRLIRNPLNMNEILVGASNGPVPRTCFRTPVPAIFEAARLLYAAVTAHQLGNQSIASCLVEMSRIPDVGEWGYSIWGSKSPYLQLRKRLISIDSTGFLARCSTRMPTHAQKQSLHERDGYHCRFCAIPVIRAEVRKKFCRVFPALDIWGPKNQQQHVAFQTMWAQYDHVVPYSNGGTNDLSNMIITCAPCNFGRMGYTLDEVNLADPREREPIQSNWDGLERFLTK